jgi:anti-repressor protein
VHALTPFNFDGAQVRAFPLNGDPWFVGKDVAAALGYANPQKAIRDHCKGGRPVGVNDTFTPLLDPQTTIIPERDVYRLILRSNLPSAERFEELVVGEILPAIRKTGSYGAPTTFPVPQTFADALRLAADLKEEVERKSADLALAAPKVAALDRIASQDGSLSITETAKTLQIRLKDLQTHLRTRAWTYQRPGTRNALAYQDKLNAGLLEHKVGSVQRPDGSEIITTSVRVTPKGLTRLARDLTPTLFN